MLHEGKSLWIIKCYVVDVYLLTRRHSFSSFSAFYTFATGSNIRLQYRLTSHICDAQDPIIECVTLEKNYLIIKLSMTIKRGNPASVLGSLPSCEALKDIFYL